VVSILKNNELLDLALVRPYLYYGQQDETKFNIQSERGSGQLQISRF